MSLSAHEIRTLRRIVSYQFGVGAGEGLFPDDDELTVRRSANDRPRQVLDSTGRLVSVGQDGRVTLGFAGGRRLARALTPPAYRVVVGDESEPFVRDGDNVFAKFVQHVDPAIRPGDEVLVVHQDEGELIGVGRAELSAQAMDDFETGMAVMVREGRSEWAEDVDISATG